MKNLLRNINRGGAFPADRGQEVWMSANIKDTKILWH